jgi:hypothetical protein
MGKNTKKIVGRIAVRDISDDMDGMPVERFVEYVNEIVETTKAKYEGAKDFYFDFDSEYVKYHEEYEDIILIRFKSLETDEEVSKRLKEETKQKERLQKERERRERKKLENEQKERLEYERLKMKFGD